LSKCALSLSKGDPSPCALSWSKGIDIDRLLRNRQPLIDHRLIVDAEASDLPGEYCSSTMIQFLVRVLQLSPGDAACRVRAAAAVGSRTSMLGLSLDPVLPQLAALQRDGAVNAEKVAIVERAMHKLTRPDLDPHAVETAEQLLTEHAVILAPAELRRFAHAVVNAADPDGPEPVDDQLQQDRRYLELKQRRDGMWHLAGRLTNTVGAQLTTILDPLTKPRTTAIEDQDGTVVEIPDHRPQVQRLHDALEEACARLLKATDQPSVGGIPASVVVTISLDDLLAKAGLAETADGSQLTSDQLLRIADEAEIWPTIPMDRPRSTTPHQQSHPTNTCPTPTRPPKPMARRRSVTACPLSFRKAQRTAAMVFNTSYASSVRLIRRECVFR
jgi:hypothetical protein